MRRNQTWFRGVQLRSSEGALVGKFESGADMDEIKTMKPSLLILGTSIPALRSQYSNGSFLSEGIKTGILQIRCRF